MRTPDLFHVSFASLVRTKSRSLLTILGIVIGVAAVILMLSIGQGAERYILGQVADLGSDLIFVEASSGDPNSGPPDPFVEQTLTLDDAEALADSGYYASVAPVLVTSTAISQGTSGSFTQVVGVTAEYADVFSVEVEEGQWISEADVISRANTVLLGQGIAEDLFGDQDPVGEKVRIKQISFRVGGVMAEQGSQFFQNLDQQVFIPITTAQSEVLGVDHVSYMAGRVREGEDLEWVKEETRFILRDEHNLDNPEGDVTKDDFAVASQADAVEVVGTIGSVLTVLLSSIAAISLVVGGIGIMNIMLVSVTERTREIGLRKAIGAKQNEILRQFLLESVILTLFGGIIGVLVGLALSYLGVLAIRTAIEGWAFVVPPEAILLGVMVSALVGLIFGVYPARRAARLDPIDALRRE